MKDYCPELLVILFLMVATFAVYLQAITFELVHVEDFVIYNELGARLKAKGFPLLGICQMPSNAVYFVPIPNFVAFLDIWLFGDKIGMLHLMNVTAHVMNSVLIFLVLRLASGCVWRSGFAAALFALHPINTENVVSWCRGPTLIVAFFFLITVLSYLYYARRPSVRRYCLIVFCLILGLLSKPSIIFLPVTLLLFDFWPLARWRTEQSGRCAPRFTTAGPVDLMLEKVPLLVISVVWMGLFIVVIRMWPALPVDIPSPANYRNWFNIPVTYVLYLWKMISPFNLPLYFPDSPLMRPSLMPLWQIVGALILLVLITGMVICRSGKHPFLITGWFWFVFCLVPYATVCVSQQRPVIARYAYLPMIGLSILVAWGGGLVLSRLGCRKSHIAIVATVLLLFLMITSWTQAGRWADKISYFKHAVDVYPDCEQRRSNLGEVLSDRGCIDEAIEQLETALRINPDFFVAHNHLGLALAQQGDQERALYHLQKAVLLKPDYPEAHNNLANLLADRSNLDGAVTHYYEALRIDPSLSQAHNNLATVLMEKGLYDEAVLHFKEALSLNPAYQTARDNLARAKELSSRRP